jgi:tetratricopeptide (TPR) repeat protein
LGSRISPNLYFRRGRLSLDLGRLDQAEAEFRRSYEVAGTHTDAGIRQELEVRCLFALGVIDWQRRNYEQALVHIRKAEEAQRRAGRTWIPDLATQRARLEDILSRR